MNAADWAAGEAGEDAVGCAVAVPAGAAPSSTGVTGSMVRVSESSSLELNANGFLQRAQGAQFLGCDERQGAPG